MEKQYYTEKFWYEDIQLHGDVSNYDQNYYANHIYNYVIKKIQDIPQDGYIVVLGTNRCVSFDKLVSHFGTERCLGIDIANPTNHPLVKVKNILDFNKSDDIPISFVHNDIGSYPFTPTAKIAAQMWAAKNTVKGGYVLGRNNLNSIKFPVEEYMNGMGFLNIHLNTLTGFLDLKDIDQNVIDGHILSKKSRPEVW